MSVPAAILASGSGSNAENIVRAFREKELCEVRLILTDNSAAKVRERAEKLGVPCRVVSPISPKALHEKALLDVLREYQVEWLFLAGYMRILGPGLLAPFKNRILNIHPSFLPEFPGLDAYRKAFEAGVSASGVTVHLVDKGVDTGKIICQERFSRLPEDTLEDFVRRGRELEWRLYPRAIRQVLS